MYTLTAILFFSLDVMVSLTDSATMKGTCIATEKYRTYDGSCNNLHNPTWGQARTAQRRFSDQTGNAMVDFEDGINEPRGGMQSRLPSPRLVSNVMSKASNGPTDRTDKKRSGMTMAFGQLLAHDVIKTDINAGKAMDCCDPNGPNFNNSDICFNFDVQADDKQFVPGCKGFLRASRASGGIDVPAFRENVNLITSYIDASFLYGSSEGEVSTLRDGNSYLMKTGDNNGLPTHSGGQCVQVQGKCPMAGDTRVHVIPNLGVSHLVWVREHNIIAKALDELNPPMNETFQQSENGISIDEPRQEMIFQETRKIIVAMVQHITFNHYLPTFLDEQSMHKYNLYSTASGYDEMYDSNVDVSIRNGFGTAPFRFGHSQIMPNQCLLKDDYKTMTVYKVEDTLKSQEIIRVNNGTNANDLVRWLAFKPAQKINRFFVDGTRNKLFVKTDAPGEDLVALNIQRGRDQGTPGFNRWREFCGLPRMEFEDFGNHSERLASLYNSTDDIDFFLGGLLEKGVNGGVGETFACVIGKQFQLLKTGDRFWYERPDTNTAFTEAQLNSIKQGANLAKMFCRNFNLSRMHADILMTSQGTSGLKDCDELPDIDLSHWNFNAGQMSLPGTVTMLFLVVISMVIR